MKRRIIKVLKVLAVIVAAAVVVLAALAVWMVRAPWPQVEGSIATAGLSAPVEVVRDAWGVPHLWAGSEEDLFFAQGYVHAQDRLWQMHLNRTVASGRLATLFGPPVLEVDRYLRTLGFRRSAARDLELLSEDTRRILEAYARGVNAFLESGETLPLEFRILQVTPEPWTVEDSLAWSKAMSFNLSLNVPLELLRVRIAGELGEAAVARFLPPYPEDGPVIVPAGAGGSGAPPAVPEEQAGLLFPALAHSPLVGGSNAWVVAGSRTRTGKPLLANDTHLALGMPSIWYENGLHGGRYDTLGFSLPGLPLVVIGQNRRIAWGVTNLNADVQDLFLERLDDPDEPTRYELRGAWEEVRTVTETLEAKGGETEELTVYLTHHGPLVHGVMPDHPLEQPFSLAWPALGGSRLLEAMARLDRAGSWEEFRDALSRWDSPSLNFVYADVEGNIGYQSTGRVPLRAPGQEGVMPVPGWTGEAEWLGEIPFAEMPSALNPESGYLVTANHKVVSDDYPYLLTRDWPPPDRARRINELLAGAGDLTVEDMRQIQADTYAPGAAVLRPYLLAAAAPEGELERGALERVAAWDLRYDVASVGAAVYHSWFHRLAQGTLADDLSPELRREFLPLAYSPSPLILELMETPDDPLFDDRATPEVEGRDEIVRRSFAAAVAWLAEGWGDDPDGWTWGRLHPATFVHQPLGQSGLAPLEALFNSSTGPAAGSAGTVDSAASDPERPFRVVFGTSQRYIADLADLSRSLAANSTGQCAHPFHRHREDQVKLWRAVELHPVFQDRETLAAEATRTLKLTPQ